MNTRPNKHGLTGVRKRCSPQHHRKPYYARYAIGYDQFVYSKNFATAEEAAAAYQRMKSEKLAQCVKTGDTVSKQINRLVILSEIQREEHARDAIIDK